MKSFDLIVSHILQNTNDNATVTALQTHTPFAVCVSSKTRPQIVTRSESADGTALLELSKLKGKELEDLLRKNKLKISGKVEEKRERLKQFYESNLKKSTGIQ